MSSEISHRFFSVVTFPMRFESIVFRTIFLGHISSIVNLFVATRFLSRNVIFIFCIERQVEFTTGKMPLLKSALVVPARRMESIKHNYIKQNEMMDL